VNLHVVYYDLMMNSKLIQTFVRIPIFRRQSIWLWWTGTWFM